jgi:hypothetical protein
VDINAMISNPELALFFAGCLFNRYFFPIFAISFGRLEN